MFLRVAYNYRLLMFFAFYFYTDIVEGYKHIKLSSLKCKYFYKLCNKKNVMKNIKLLF